MWLEHLTVNQRVLGSSPRGGATQPTKYLVFTGLLIFREFLIPYFIPKIPAVVLTFMLITNYLLFYDL